MQYHHIYHAGNFSDVFKHCTLITLIKSLGKKDKSIFYLDTHAGIGKYDLTSKAAQKTREYETGIALLYKISDTTPEIIKTYLNIVRANNYHDPSFLHYYPGSPIIIRSLLRPQDRMILTELNSDDIKILKQEFLHDKQVAVHHTNGYQSIKAFLPPQQGRGLILIDPAFEDPTEFGNIISALEIAKEKFPTGIYAIWYPIKDDLIKRDFYYELSTLGFQNILLTEFSLGKSLPNETKLKSCGMAIINAPWKIDMELKPIITYLNNVLTKDTFRYTNVNWLTNP